VLVTELCSVLGISESTVRRDLYALSKQGKLVRVHGGATINEQTYKTIGTVVSARKVLHEEEKHQIAGSAAALVENGDCVYLDGSSTIEKICEHLGQTRAYYVTNSLSIAQRMGALGKDIVLLGGKVYSASGVLIGPEACRQLQLFNFTKGFFGTAGITTHAGCTVTNIDEALVKRQAIEQSRTPYILADASKFGVVAAVTFADFDAVSIITSKRLHKRYADCTNITRVDG
jgi:DeoR family fructose operon transcriptional repressor